MIIAFLRRLTRRLRYRHFDRDLSEELASHGAMAEEEFRQDGVEAAEARRRAARQLGNITLERERSRAVWIPVLVEQFLQDARYACRSLARRPGFTLAAAVMLTVGMGLVGASYTLFNGVFVRGWNLPDSDRVIVVKMARATVSTDTTSNGFSLRAYRHLAASSRSADYVAFGEGVFKIGPVSHSGDQTIALFVSDNFIEVMQLPLQLGRGWPKGSSGQPAVVISDRRWRRTFAADPNVVGRTAWVNGTIPVTVTGVIARAFDGLGPQPVDAVVALSNASALAFCCVPELGKDDASCCHTIAGRLRDGWTASQAEQEAELLASQFRRTASLTPVRISLSDTSAAASLNTARGRTMLTALSLIVVASALVWLLSCANVGNLYLAQSLRRRNEIAMRLALGASRARVVRQLVTEGVALAALSGAGAFACAASVPLLFNMADNAPLSLFPTDWRVAAVVGAAAVLTSVIVSLAPALQITKAPWRMAAARSSPGTNRLRSLLLAAQITMATVLVLSASLLTRAIGEAMNLDTDYALNTTSTISLDAPAARSDEARRLATRQAVDALASATDLSLALVNTVPSSGFNSLLNAVSAPGSSVTVQANLIPMSAAAFRVLELPLVRGRFASSDSTAAEAVVNERLADLMWPGSRDLGQTLIVHFDKRLYRVVGVVRNSHLASLDQVRPLVHIAPRADLPTPMFITRTVPGLEERVRAIVNSANPGVVARVSPFRDSMRQTVENAATGAAIAGSLGTVALLLAMLGVFTVFAYIVEERRREVGIRLALGASRRQVRMAMFRVTRSAVAGGLAAGLGLSVISGYLLRGFLFGLSPLDPLSYAAVALLLLGSAVVATAIPVGRALRIDPVVALKGDGT